jgi:hypothetical protein
MAAIKINVISAINLSLTVIPDSSFGGKAEGMRAPLILSRAKKRFL